MPKKELAEIVAEIGTSAVPISVGIAHAEDNKAAYARIAADGRRLDIIVANAGRAEMTLLDSVNAESKAAVRSLGRTFAQELMPRGIRVNTLNPGPVDTPIIETNTPSPRAATEFRTYAASITPIKRLRRPDELSSAALFLASDDSSFATGMELLADGGHAERSHQR